MAHRERYPRDFRSRFFHQKTWLTAYSALVKNKFFDDEIEKDPV